MRRGGPRCAARARLAEVHGGCAEAGGLAVYVVERSGALEELAELTDDEAAL